MNRRRSPLRYRVFGIAFGVTAMMLLLVLVAWLDPSPPLLGSPERATFYVVMIILWPIFLIAGAFGGSMLGDWLYIKLHPPEDEDDPDFDELFRRLWDQK